MMYRSLLGSFLALLGWAGLAHAQPGLGAPIAPETQIESGHGPHTPALCRADCEPRPVYPILAKIARRVMMPFRAATGRVRPPQPEEVPSKEKVAHMIVDGGYSPAEITAAKIKIDEAQAKARRAAVKYLALIDCHYYPEAEAGLVAALRADRSEMVRYEAALALGNGRSLTDKMLEALNMTALGLELDGNPAETSERVRSAARMSLQRNMARGLCLPPLGDVLPAMIDGPFVDAAILQPIGYFEPMYLPTTPPVTQRERELARTISAPHSSASESRGAGHFLHKLMAARATPQPVRASADPRLRGLAPLGSEASLGMPASLPVPSAPAPSYNYRD